MDEVKFYFKNPELLLEPQFLDETLEYPEKTRQSVAQLLSRFILPNRRLVEVVQAIKKAYNTSAVVVKTLIELPGKEKIHAHCFVSLLKHLVSLRDKQRVELVLSKGIVHAYKNMENTNRQRVSK